MELYPDPTGGTYRSAPTPRPLSLVSTVRFTAERGYKGKEKCKERHWKRLKEGWRKREDGRKGCWRG